MIVRSTSALFVAALLGSAAAAPALAQASTTDELQLLRNELELLRAEDAARAARMDALERRLENISAAPVSPPPPPDAPIATRPSAEPSPARQQTAAGAPQADAASTTLAAASEKPGAPRIPILYPGEGTH